MCGIAGFYNFDKTELRETNLQLLKKMTDAISHRGPDDAGQWYSNDMPLYLGHRRLSIVDLSREGHQPMISKDERYILSYNGEIYNFLDLKKDLENLGHRFRGHSDSEILIEAISRWGLETALEKIEGMFAFALWDQKQRKLHLLRDRFGEKPLYFGWAGQKFVFASELKPFMGMPDFQKELNQDACSLLIRFMNIPAPLSIFKNIWKLPPASMISLSFYDLEAGQDLSARIVKYYELDQDFDAKKGQTLSDEDLTRQLHETLSGAVKLRMISDAPLGAFLSGGIDSSLIVSLMQSHSSTPVKTYTIGFEEEHYDESPYAEKIAVHLGTKHETLHINQNIVQGIIEKIPTIYDEPFADPSQLPTFFLFQFAGQHVKTALSGDGGDEFFAGYHHHDLLPRIWPKMQHVPHSIRQMSAAAGKAIPKSFLKNFGEGRGYLYYKRLQTFSRFAGSKNLDEAQLNMHSNHLNAQIFTKDQNRNYYDFSDRLASDHKQYEEQDLSRLLRNDIAFYLPEDILTKSDRASMANSLEVRAPFLDRNVLRIAGQIPDHLRIKNGQGKIVLKQILEEYMPREYFDRKKAGFNAPIEQWLMGPLKDWGADLLYSKDFDQDPILDRKYVLKTWNKLQSGHKESGRVMWSLLMLQQWRKYWSI